MDLGPFDRQILRMRRLCLTTLLGALGLTALAGRLVANKAMRPVHRLKKITEALLTLSRADSGSLQLDKRTFSMSEALESFCEDAEILCSEKALTFSCEIEPGLAVHSDRAVILSVFHNLLSNAMKYNEPDGQVRIRARRRGQFAEVEIANSGPPLRSVSGSRSFGASTAGKKPAPACKDGFDDAFRHPAALGARAR